MDEFSKVIADLMAQSGTTENSEPSVPTEDAAPEPSMESALGGLDIMGLLGGMSPPSQSKNTELLIALKPYLNSTRCDKVDKAISLVRTAYMIRTALSSLGGIINV